MAAGRGGGVRRLACIMAVECGVCWLVWAFGFRKGIGTRSFQKGF